MTKVNRMFNVDEDVHDWFIQYCDDNDTVMSALVRRWMREFKEKMEGK